jgi:hypothetical protein
MTTISQEFGTQSTSTIEAFQQRSLGPPAPRTHGRPSGTGSLLPLELEFIPQHGVSVERVLRVLADAPCGIEPLDAVLREGVIPEEEYYQALAQHLGCAYYTGQPSFASGFDALKGLRSGVAPLRPRGRGPRAVIAPGAPQVARLIEMTTSGLLRPESFAVASPHRFASLIRLRGAEAVLKDSLGRLPKELSAKRGMSVMQIAAVGALALSATALGAKSMDVLAAVVSSTLWLVFLSSIAFRSAAVVAHKDDVPSRKLSDDELPLYTIVVPVYREANVIRELVRAIDALDYPKSKLDIKLVAERGDQETLSRIAMMRLPARYELIIAPPGQPMTKPRALNIALAAAQGELLVVYDAEDAPASDQLQLAASRFAAESGLDCLQARLTVRNSGDSWLSKLFAIEYAVLFDLVNPGLCALDMPIALGGTSNHFRVASLLGAGRWDEWNVAEDADLGVRLARSGYRVGSLISDTSEEAPCELGNWFRQRTRWQKGWMRLSSLMCLSRNFKALRRELRLYPGNVATPSQQTCSLRAMRLMRRSSTPQHRTSHRSGVEMQPWAASPTTAWPSSPSTPRRSIRSASSRGTQRTSPRSPCSSVACDAAQCPRRRRRRPLSAVLNIIGP